MKKDVILKTILTIVITGIVTFTVTYVWIYSGGSLKGILSNSSSTSTIGAAIKSDALNVKLQKIKSKIYSDYLGDIDENKLQEYAIKGYVAGLGDQYSQYYTVDEMTELTSDTLGKYVGIGIYMTLDTEKNKIQVYSVMENSPAEKSGLKAGDYIVGIDGNEVSGDDYDQISSKIKGKAGSSVKITIERNNDKKEFEVKRENISIIRVTGQMLDNNIGYIYISSFDGEIKKQFEEKYNELVKNGATSLIIDLRNNGGGIVDEATEIGDMFTDKGTTLLIEENNKKKQTKVVAKTDKKITMKTCVLVNKYSASASEILAGIFKDVVDNVTVIGETTYGKGVIQALYQLADGSGLKLTIEEYLTPNSNKINKVGVTPDIEVKGYTFKETLEKDKDTQLQKAIEVLTNK